MSRFLLRFPSFSAHIPAKSRPLRQTLFASSATGGASQALPPTSQLVVQRFRQRFRQQKSTAIAVLEWLPMPRLNQRHREPCHASSCGSRLFLLIFLQKADRCAKPCSLLPPPAALLRLCHRLRNLSFSVSDNVSDNKKALQLQCLNGSPCPA